MNVARVVRFGMVGFISTATYFVVTVLAGRSPILLDSRLANLAGFCASV